MQIVQTAKEIPTGLVELTQVTEKGKAVYDPDSNGSLARALVQEQLTDYLKDQAKRKLPSAQVLLEQIGVHAPEKENRVYVTVTYCAYGPE